MSSPETAQFDPLARLYDGMEAILAGGKLERCRRAFLGNVASARNVLLVGEGHGKFLVEIIRRFPEAEVTYLDASPKMLEVARARLMREGLLTRQVTFVAGDLLQSPLTEYDLIATHFFLDCLTPVQLALAVEKLASSLQTGGAWLLSDFQIPAAGWKRWRAGIIHWLMYRFFRVVTRLPAVKITEPAPQLVKSGLVCEGRIEFDWGLLYAELWRKA